MYQKSVILVLSTVCFCLFVYGVILNLFISISWEKAEHRKNECSMTFMFELPVFIEINMEKSVFPQYKLWAYAEGFATESVRNMNFNGAPVLFVHGNGGSYKQSRSLASVALRKGIDNDWIYHLDYFAVDFNGEYSALFGGVLENQTKFLEHCITTIMKLYQRLPHPPQKIVVVGHSIGGKIAQKLLFAPKTAHLISTVIALASPMDRPVLNLDNYINVFYQSTDLIENRHMTKLSENSCCSSKQRRKREKNSRSLDETLLITVGGGNRDLMVHPKLTSSKFSDLHVMTTEMNKVWVEADHLCIVWCLQLVLVLNRFLFSIIEPANGSKFKGLSFIKSKDLRIAKAEEFLLGTPHISKNIKKKLRGMETPGEADWIEDNRRIFTQKFKDGTNRTRIQMIRLIDSVLHHTVHVDVINQETNEWAFGCEAVETTGTSRFCSKATPIYQEFQSKLPDRSHLNLNLHTLKKNNPKWTHVLLRFSATREPFQFSVDIHNPSDRQLKVSMPKWFSFSSKNILEDTLAGSIYYQLNVTGLDETHQALEIIVTPKSCTKHRTLARICIPWTDGFNRFHHFTYENNFIVWTPESRPVSYNTSANPILVEIFGDPSCHYSISVRQSFGQTFAKIVHQFSHWLPAHLIAIVCLSLRQQLSQTPNGQKTKCGSFHNALTRCSPFFVLAVTRVFYKLILMLKILPSPEILPTSLTVSILIHGTALILLIGCNGAIWAAITFGGSIAHKILFRITKLPVTIISDTILEKFPASCAILLIAISFNTCGGIALVLACLIYFILLSKMYEDYLENFVYKTVKRLAFGRISKNCHSTTHERVGRKNDATETEEKALQEKSDHQDDIINEQLDAKARNDDGAESKDDSGLSEISFHLPLFLMLLILTLLSVPSTVSWAKNYHHSKVLSPDPSFIPANCVLVTLISIWQRPAMFKRKFSLAITSLYYKVIGTLLYSAAVASVLYCQEAIFKLNFVIASVFFLVAIHQLVAPQVKHHEASSR